MNQKKSIPKWQANILQTWTWRCTFYVQWIKDYITWKSNAVLIFNGLCTASCVCCPGQAVQPLHNKVTFTILRPIGQCWPLHGIQKNPRILHHLPTGDNPRVLWIQVTRYAKGDQRVACQLQWLCIQGHECTGVERSCRKLFTLDLFESIAAVLWFFSMICNLSLFGSS